MKLKNEQRLANLNNMYADKQRQKDQSVQWQQYSKELMMHETGALKTLKLMDKKETVKRIMKMQDYQRAQLMEKIEKDS